MSHYRYYPTHAALLQNKPSTVSGEAPADVLAAAIAAADAVISSGAVSRRSNCDHSISISGHSNEDHEPTPGSSNDEITIRVMQKSEAPKLELVRELVSETKAAFHDLVEEGKGQADGSAEQESEVATEVEPDAPDTPATSSVPDVPASGGEETAPAAVATSSVPDVPASGGEETAPAAVTGEQTS